MLSCNKPIMCSFLPQFLNIFAGYIPDAIKSSCTKCTEKQKRLSATFIKGLQSKYAGDYAVLYKIHDPEAKYGAELKQFLDTYAG